jgi:hypothetical protein
MREIDEERKQRWARYGLSIGRATLELSTPAYIEKSAAAHDAVCDWLDAHPEEAKEYRPDQTGALRYFDVLKLAMGEEALKALTVEMQAEAALRAVAMMPRRMMVIH